MGCDIHTFFEVKQGNEWVPLEGTYDNDEEGYISTFGNIFKFRRNYNSFAILANVRNGLSAGCDTGDGYEPISEPRGVPVDASDVYKQLVEQWGIDGHTHSYFTLQELLDLEQKKYWEKTTKSRGYVHLIDYMRMKIKNQKQPDSWCGNTSAPKITQEQIDEFIKEGDFYYSPEQLNVYLHYEWENTYAEDGKQILELIKHLQTLNITPENLRFCFFFDN